MLGRSDGEENDLLLTEAIILIGQRGRAECQLVKERKRDDGIRHSCLLQ